ncbi:hypothetical protein [Nonomuraea sp. NPDC046570]
MESIRIPHRGLGCPRRKPGRVYQGAIDVASIRIWLRDPVT